jgi:hypothetical protein
MPTDLKKRPLLGNPKLREPVKILLRLLETKLTYAKVDGIMGTKSSAHLRP